MERIDDWGDSKRVPPEQTPGRRKVPLQPTLAQAIFDGLKDFKPHILTVHCYQDVGHPWVRVVFASPINPDVALRVGEALAKKVGDDCVYLNSLRPRAVCFLLKPAFDPEPDLPVSRYGELLAGIKVAWSRKLPRTPR